MQTRTMNLRPHALRPLAALLMAAALASTWTAVAAETLTWRQASVQTGREGNVTLRRGVVLFGNGEPATMTVRLQPVGAPKDGVLPMLNETSFRFEDGSTLTMQAPVAVRLGADGRAVRGENTNDGKFIAGTGRFQGATGSYHLRVRTDIDTAVDGTLGDYFAVGQAEWQRAP